MERIEDPADAGPVLLASLRVLALAPTEQIALFAPHCVACLVRNTFRRWEEEFTDSPFVDSLTPRQRTALERIRGATSAVVRDPEFECNEVRYVQESPLMAALRKAAKSGLASFGWQAGPPELAHVYGTPQCADRVRAISQWRSDERLATRRMEPEVPHFHAATFQMHAHPLRANQSRFGEIERWEAKYAMKLPGAVREWYAMEGPDLWARVRPRDFVPPLEKVVPLRPAFVRGLKPDDVEPFFTLLAPTYSHVQLLEAADSYSYLQVFSDTDVGIPCLVRIDGSDDPPVFILPDGGKSLELTSPHYSVFHFDQLADAWFPGMVIRRGWRSMNACRARRTLLS